jgi:hypothetical protein
MYNYFVKYLTERAIQIGMKIGGTFYRIISIQPIPLGVLRGDISQIVME